MPVGRTVALIGAALRPGANLAHDPNHLAPADALIALGRLKEPAGAAVVHSRVGGEKADAVKQVLLEWAVVEFERREWEVSARGRYSPTKVMRQFVDQVWREFFGKACAKCEGRGFRGRKFDAVRHGLEACNSCHGRGFIGERIDCRPCEGKACRWCHGTGTRFKYAGPCKPCRGKGYKSVSLLVRGTKLRACPSCDGAGVVRASLRARARALGYSAPTVARIWRERFQVVLAELRRIERAALFECDNFLFGVE